MASGTKHFLYNRTEDWRRMGRAEGLTLTAEGLTLPGPGNGLYTSLSLDTQEVGTVWHRLRLHAAVPADALLRLYLYCSDSDRMPPEFRPEGQQEQPLDDWLAAAPSEEEAEDAFYRYHRRVRLGDVQLKELMGTRPAFIDGTPLKDGYAVSFGGVRVDDVRAAAKSMGASVTAFMCGAIARAVHNTQSRPSRDVVLMVPVNLRDMFPSRTLRNFVNFVRLVFRHGECTTLADFVSSAAKQLKEKATPDEMAKFMSTTVSTERSLPLRLAPLGLKILAARIVRFFIKSRQTLIFSNLGRVSLPEGTGVRRIVFNLNVSKTSRVNIGALSLGDEMTVAFTRSVRERTLEDELFAVLEGAGVTAVCRGDSVGQPDINGTLAHNTSL